MATDYAQLGELKQRVKIRADITTSDTLLQQLLDTSAYIIDQFTRRPPEGKVAFSATASEERFFDDYGYGEVQIDDLLSSSAPVVKIGGTTLATTYYTFHPYNKRPYTQVIFSGAYWPLPTSITGTQAGVPYPRIYLRSISITGIWGYCALADRPAVVKEATLTQAERLYDRMGISIKDLMAAMRDPFEAVDPIVKLMLSGLVKPEGRVFVA